MRQTASSLLTAVALLAGAATGCSDGTRPAEASEPRAASATPAPTAARTEAGTGTATGTDTGTGAGTGTDTGTGTGAGTDTGTGTGAGTGTDTGSGTGAGTGTDTGSGTDTGGGRTGTASTTGAPPPVDEPGDRIYAKARHVWIQPAPRPSKGWLGYLTLGGSVRLWQGSAEKARTVGGGCDAWYRVEPEGYVCAGDDATLDPEDPAFAALRAKAGDATSPTPFRYAESIGARRYVEVPSPAEQRKREWDLDEHRARLERARTATSPAELPKELVGVDLTPAGTAMPELFAFGPRVREARDSVALGSTVAFVDQFDHEGRTWLLTSDRALVPKDRVKPYPAIDFEGVHLGGDVALPIAFFRKKDRPSYKRAADGTFAVGPRTFARKSWIGLTDRREDVAGVTYAETREPGVWIRVDEAAIAEAATEPPRSDLAERGGRQTWLDVSVLGGTLVAYEGMKPVFATLIAPGRGGIPVPGKDPISTASTPIGTFRVDGKFVWATMVSSTDSSIVHSEVMYVQNFHGAHALHGAYWHDGWGELKSGGCVNLSPKDSQWLFHWTEPRVPAGWHGLRSVAAFGPPTIVRVRR